MSTTIWGAVCKVGDVGAKYDRYGRLTEIHKFDELELQLPDDGIQVTVGHDPNLVIGELRHAELSTQGVLSAVCGVDEKLAAWPDELFFSPEFVVFGGGHGQVCNADTARLEGLSIVEHPASIYARSRPLHSLPGDYREARDRGSWQVTWGYRAPLVKRALETRSTGIPLGIHRELPLTSRRFAYDSEQYGYSRAAGVRIEHSRHRGKILHVSR